MTRATVDRALCSGYERCIQLAPQGFRLDDDRKSVPVVNSQTATQDLIDAAEACPMQAITIWDGDGAQLYP